MVFLMFAFCTKCNTQERNEAPENNNSQLPDEEPTLPEVDTLFAINAPNSITRNIIEDKKGNIWFASFEDIIRYDGSSFTRITTDKKMGRFFSVLEDKNGNFWFTTIGEGVYYYDGSTFQNFTIKDGLANNRVPFSYEDSKGNIWFGTEEGASRYDGESFQNFTLKNGLPNNDVNSIAEDHNGKIWVATRNGVSIHDGETFTNFNKNNGSIFGNVRSLITDSKGNIWLGGNDGLWRYSEGVLSQFSADFVGYVYEDKKGNIWTSSKSIDFDNWVLSQYDEKVLTEDIPSDNNTFSNAKASVIKTGDAMLFGILEDQENNIWVGTLNGVFKYDGKASTYFRSNR